MDVRDVGVALWRQRTLVALILVITGSAVAAGIFLAPKTYAATATISAAEEPGVAASDDPDALRATLAELANSRGVVDEVRDRISTDRSVAELRRSIQGDWVRGTILVDVTVEDRDPDEAAAIANAVTAVLVDGDVVGEVAGPSLDHSLVLTTSDPALVPETSALLTCGSRWDSGCCWPSAWRSRPRSGATDVPTPSTTPPRSRTPRPHRCWPT